MKEIQVGLQANDPLTYAGLAGFLESRSEMTLLPVGRQSDADVIVAAVERLSRSALSALREPTADYATPVVLVTTEINEADLMDAVRCRVVSIVPRAEATSDRLINSVLAATSGGGVMSPAPVGELLKHVKELHQDMTASRGSMRAGLSPREVDVLRLMADGMSTAQVAVELRYSERTVKNVVHGITGRLNLRNRPHAVAYAVRSGVI